MTNRQDDKFCHWCGSTAGRCLGPDGLCSVELRHIWHTEAAGAIPDILAPQTKENTQ